MTKPTSQPLFWSLLLCVSLVAAGASTVYLNQPKQHTLSIRAGIIRGSGDVYPAARNTLIFSPYSFNKLRNELKSLNKVGPEPEPPEKYDDRFDPKIPIPEKPEDPDLVYQNFERRMRRPQSDDARFKTDCSYYFYMEETYCYTDHDAFSKALKRWENARNNARKEAESRMQAWEQQIKQQENARQKAYEAAYQKYLKDYHDWIEKGETNLDQVLREKLTHQKVYRTRTDLDGRARITLPHGEWFLTGGNSNNFAAVFWHEMPIEITAQSRELELANDMEHVETLNILEDKEPDLSELMNNYLSGYSELEKAFENPRYLRRQLARYHLIEKKNLSGWSFLHLVAAAAPVPQRAELSHLLLMYGADPDQTNQEGQTPVHLAVEHNNRTTLMFLLAWGANPNISDHETQTPLHLAVESERASLIPILLRHGADLNLVNGKGQTPLELARALKREKILPLLLPPSPSPSPTATASPSVQTSPSASGKPSANDSPVASAKPSAQASPAVSAKPSASPQKQS